LKFKLAIRETLIRNLDAANLLEGNPTADTWLKTQD